MDLFFFFQISLVQSEQKSANKYCRKEVTNVMLSTNLQEEIHKCPYFTCFTAQQQVCIFASIILHNTNERKQHTFVDFLLWVTTN